MRAKIKKDELIYLTFEQVTQDQIEKMRSLYGVIDVIEEAAPNLMPGQQALRVELKSVDQLPLIFDFIFDQKIKLINFKQEEPSLEDAFIELTKRA